MNLHFSKPSRFVYQTSIRILFLLLLLTSGCQAGDERSDVEESDPGERFTPEGSVGSDNSDGRISLTTQSEAEEFITIGFYNVENLFDPEDDPTTDDDDFTPRGKMKWTTERMEAKLESIARAVRLMNENNGPDILGVCEVENRYVLERLVEDYLPRGMYDIVHTDSPDGRGIDVALIYNRLVAKPRPFVLHTIDLGPGQRPTRGILEVPFERNGRTFTLLVNHWPSRSGGEEQSEPRRIRAARVAAGVVDSLTALDVDADIVLVGDFNDEPTNRSVEDVLDARYPDEVLSSGSRLLNLAAVTKREGEIGSYLYQDEWEVLDQIMVSPGLRDRQGLALADRSMTIFHPDFLRDFHPSAPLNPPRRTFVRGTLYIGGTSDHFPVFARFGWFDASGNQ